MGLIFKACGIGTCGNNNLEKSTIIWIVIAIIIGVFLLTYSIYKLIKFLKGKKKK